MTLYFLYGSKIVRPFFMVILLQDYQAIQQSKLHYYTKRGQKSDRKIFFSVRSQIYSVQKTDN